MTIIKLFIFPVCYDRQKTIFLFFSEESCFFFLFIRLKRHTQINAIYYTKALCVRVSYSLTTVSEALWVDHLVTVHVKEQSGVNENQMGGGAFLGSGPSGEQKTILHDNMGHVQEIPKGVQKSTSLQKSGTSSWLLINLLDSLLREILY